MKTQKLKTRALPRCAALSGLASLLTLGVSGAALCQTTQNTSVNVAPDPVRPSELDRSQSSPSTRAEGMGGTGLVLGTDIVDASYNPASIAQAGSYSVGASVVGNTSNVHVSKINDLSKGLKDLGNKVNGSSGNQSLVDIRDSFQKVYNFATDAGANDSNGSPANVGAGLTSAAGVSVKNVGVVVYGSLAAEVRLNAYNQGYLKTNYTGLGSPSGALRAGYGVLGFTNIAVPFSIPLQVGTLGISPRITQASFASAGFVANETDLTNGVDANGTPNGNIIGGTYKEVHEQKFDVDLGFTSIPDPIYHVRGAIVVRNLLSPSYHLPLTPNGAHFGAQPSFNDFNFTQKPQIDIGAAREDSAMNLSYALEVHDLNNVNGGKRSLHAGVEYGVNKMFFVRGGYDQSRFVAGLGFAAGGFRLDIASGTNPEEKVALSLSYRVK